MKPVLHIVFDTTELKLWAKFKNQVKPTFIASKNFINIKHNKLYFQVLYNYHSHIWETLEDKHWGRNLNENSQ